MTDTLPKRLGRSPLLSALFEVRFEPTHPGVASLLPGQLLPSLQENFVEATELPLAGVPQQLRDADPNLKFATTHQIRTDASHLSVGPRAITFASQTYPGWAPFGASIGRLLDALASTGHVRSALRFSLRYQSLLEQPFDTFRSLNVSVEVAGAAVNENGLHLRFENTRERLLIITQIAHAEAVNPVFGKKTGILVDIDTVFDLTHNQDFLKESRTHLLDECHDGLKKTFFNLLSSQTLQALSPEY